MDADTINTAANQKHTAERYVILAAELRALAAECERMADAAPNAVVGRAARNRAQIFRSAAAVADHARWCADEEG